MGISFSNKSILISRIEGDTKVILYFFFSNKDM